MLESNYTVLSKPIALSQQKWSKETSALVSVGTLTFNHNPFIREALDSILQQKTTFPVQLVVFDDCSTDGTREIVKEYEEKYPHLIIGVYPEENTYGKPERIKALRPYYKLQATSKYLALCEGDDYWADTLKLEKQVSFLENNSGYTLIVGGFVSKHQYTGVEKKVIRKPKSTSKLTKLGYSFDLQDTFSNWNTKTLTAVYLNDQEVLKNLEKYQFRRDVHLVYHLLKQGKGFYFTEIFGVHRIHIGGVHSMIASKTRVIKAFRIYDELYLKNRDTYTRRMNLKYHCLILNYKLFGNMSNSELDISKFQLIKKISKLITKPSDLFFFGNIFIGTNSRAKLKSLLK